MRDTQILTQTALIAPAVLPTQQEQINEVLKLHGALRTTQLKAYQDALTVGLQLGEKLSALRDNCKATKKSFNELIETIPIDRSHIYRYIALFENKSLVEKAVELAKEHGEELSLRTALGLIKAAKSSTPTVDTTNVDELDPFTDNYAGLEVELNVGKRTVAIPLSVLHDKYKLFKSQAKGLAQSYETKANVMKLVAQRVATGTPIEDDILTAALEALELA